MKLRNTTNISDATIRNVVRAVRPPGIGSFDVMVRNGRARGTAYTNGSRYHHKTSQDPFIVAVLPKSEREARIIWPAGKGYLEHTTGSRLEVLLYITAHELRHLWQRQHPRGRRVWGSRGRMSERDADAYALQMLRKFRRGELGTFRDPLKPTGTRKVYRSQTKNEDVEYRINELDANGDVTNVDYVDTYAAAIQESKRRIGDDVPALFIEKQNWNTNSSVAVATAGDPRVLNLAGYGTETPA